MDIKKATTSELRVALSLQWSGIREVLTAPEGSIPDSVLDSFDSECTKFWETFSELESRLE